MVYDVKLIAFPHVCKSTVRTSIFMHTFFHEYYRNCLNKLKFATLCNSSVIVWHKYGFAYDFVLPFYGYLQIPISVTLTGIWIHIKVHAIVAHADNGYKEVRIL